MKKLFLPLALLMLQAHADDNLVCDQMSEKQERTVASCETEKAPTDAFEGFIASASQAQMAQFEAYKHKLNDLLVSVDAMDSELQADQVARVYGEIQDCLTELCDLTGVAVWLQFNNNTIVTARQLVARIEEENAQQAALEKTEASE